MCTHTIDVLVSYVFVRELLNSTCRDSAGSPIVDVHMYKCFLNSLFLASNVRST